jgi:hypothetical protein
MMKPSPVPRFREDECYAFAKGMVQCIAKRPHKRATESFLASHVSKPIELQPYEVRQIARFYWRTFMLEPFGETTRVILR